MKKRYVSMFIFLLLILMMIGQVYGQHIPRKLIDEKMDSYINTSPFKDSLSSDRSWGRWWPDFPARYESFFNVTSVKDLEMEAFGLASADFNNDGLTDFASSWHIRKGTYESFISIFYNNDDGSFTDEIVVRLNELQIDNAIGYPPDITDLDAGDFDNDGDIDFIITYSEAEWLNGLPYRTNGTGVLLKNNGNNEFSKGHQVFWHGPGTPDGDNNRINPHVTSADYDMDGDLDVLVGDNTGLVSFYKNDGNGNFGHELTFGFDDMRTSWGLSSADFDNDGDIDFVVTQAENTLEGAICLKYNDGTPDCFDHDNWSAIVEGDPYSFDFLSLSPLFAYGELSTLDYNDDGLTDVLFGTSGPGCLLLFIQQEDFLFESFSVARFPAENDGFGGFGGDVLLYGDFCVGDFNNDGLDDVVTGGGKAVIRLFSNTLTLIDIVFPDRAMIINNNEVRSWILPFYYPLKYGTSLVTGDITIKTEELESLSKVEFYLDDKLVFTDEESPFEWEWNRFSFGRHTVKAQAYDLEGDPAGFDTARVWKFL